MWKWLLIFMLVCTPCLADVTAEILDVSQDPNNGSIIVKTNYVLDGVEVQSRYPTLNGKYYWVTRYNVDKFAGMTDLQAKNFILSDLQKFAQSIIKKEYFRKVNFQYTQDKASLLIGTTGTVQNAEVLVDTDADGIIDTKWTVKSDGTRTEAPYIP